MNVADLIEILSDCDPEAQVRIATQPNYPLEFTVGGVATLGDLREAEHPGGEVEEEIEDEDYPTGVVWILEGRPEGYASRQLWNVANHL